MQGELPTEAIAATDAVFLSYASQDAAAIAGAGTQEGRV